MEGVGARFGRSSTRYVPVTVFTGPVRKWKKRWVPLTYSHVNHHHHHSTFSSPANGNNSADGSSSHLLLYKWTPVGQNGSNVNESSALAKLDSKNGNSSDRDGEDSDGPPKRKFKYMPICLLENERNNSSPEVECSIGMDDEDKKPDAPSTKEFKPTSLAQKPDNDIAPTNDCQGVGQGIRQDLNERLELSF